MAHLLPLGQKPTGALPASSCAATHAHITIQASSVGQHSTVQEPQPEQCLHVWRRTQMADVRMPYALDQDQRLVHVNDVQRGAAAGCSCLSCGQPVWAKPGDELSRHFAHAVATESALHMAAQTMVAQSVNYIRQDNGAYPIWLRCECGYSAGTMPIQGQHLVAKTERQSTSNTRRDVVIQQPDGTSLYVMEILVTHAVEPDAWRSHNAANIPAGEAMAGWGNAAHNAARRSRQNVQPRPHTNLPCRHGTRKESAHR